MRRLAAACLLVLAFSAFAAPAGSSNDALFGQQWGLAKVHAPQAWSTANGNGVVIAVVDSGVDLEHGDLRDKIVPGANFVEPGQPPRDDCGHGTHVAGIAAAETSNGIGVAGVAPGAKIMPVRVLASDGSGGCGGENVEAGIRWAADHGARVINMSFGEDTQALFGSSFSDAIRYAWAKGAIPVVSAGNEFILSSGFGDEPAVVVAATDRDDNKPFYSSGVGRAQWGIAAPGGRGSMFGSSRSSEDILSTYFDASNPANHNLYTSMAGTSMAAPFVSGAAAILLSMGLSKEQVVQRLLSTADDLGSPGTFGHGRLNLERAVRASGAATARPQPSNTSPARRSSGFTPAAEEPRATMSVRYAAPTASLKPTPTGAVETPSDTPGSYAAPDSSSDSEPRSPLPLIAAAVAGLGGLVGGAWTLYRSRPRRA